LPRFRELAPVLHKIIVAPLSDIFWGCAFRWKGTYVLDAVFSVLRRNV